MQLIVGYSYGVLDYHKQQEFAAQYIGKAVDMNHHFSEPLFVLERQDKTVEAWTLAGCQLRCHVDKDGEVTPYLYATHYGNTVEDLFPNGVMRREPSWEIA